MRNDGFNTQVQRAGAHVPSQQEWNDLSGATGNVQIGENEFSVSDVSPSGTNIPSDAFFFPHVAQVDLDNTSAIISPDREEPFYPYTDSLSVPNYIVSNTFELIGNKWRWTGD